MKRLALSITCTALLGLTLTACDSASDTPAPASSAPAATSSSSAASKRAAFPKGEAGAKALTEALRSADGPETVKTLQPTAADYAAVFTDDLAGKAESFYKTKLWNGEKIDMGVSAAQTDLKLFQATTDDIRKWTPAVKRDFPGGYEQLGPHLKPGLTVYRWKYTEPGADSGRAYEGLVFVNDHWIWVPKAWEILEK
ncbi:hypothetical protein KZZ52_24870 [Dactylosporangium sp. AC04546]|uniref:hypothetical protein n=1 Tax=Dactylosporangium sp. AC04546 TaxID=2862460 RepID=UPI001EDF0725|nr:hypothetical protein [Dactylosporangium sp. AC04546]WVK88505.1 hypothetical protein KZZ52_24870 [Dactylosporangium sp. AC04546]